MGERVNALLSNEKLLLTMHYTYLMKKNVVSLLFNQEWALSREPATCLQRVAPQPGIELTHGVCFPEYELLPLISFSRNWTKGHDVGELA